MLTYEERNGESMENYKRDNDDISIYIKDQESVANAYVMRCFSVTMLVYTITFLLNVLGIFVIEQRLMLQGFIPSLVIYLLVYFVTKSVDSSNRKLKYFVLGNIILVFTITGVFLTYHVVLVTLLPFLYATLYSSKKVMYYVYFLTVISTIIIVYGGYYYGLSDANMVLLTTGSLADYTMGGKFTLQQINENPLSTLFLFFVLPRCLIYVAFVSVCNSIYSIVSSSLERAKLTEELERAKIEAENASRAKSQFLAKVSHEIRTPINAVIGMNELILRESTEENVRKYAGDVKDSSVLLLNIINEILDSSKIESGKMEIIVEKYDMGSFLNDLYNMISIRAKEKNLQLIFDIDTNLAKAYYGDEKRIKQVLLNLLTNAVKYTDKGTVTFGIACHNSGNKSTLTYSVKDTGIGIREENIAKIYDTFQRFDIIRNRDVEGTGLGMNISQQLLKLMGSELQIKSEYNKGSEFSFVLEQEIAGQEVLGDFRQRLQASQNNIYHSAYTAPDAKILAVDDNKMNLKVFRGLLKQTQMQIYEAESGKECLEILKKQKFDLIFLDHMMPGMDGIETLHNMKELHLCDDVPVIMLTANAIIGDEEKYLKEGFDDFLTKPILPDRLDKIIRKHLPEGLFYMEDDEHNDEVTEECILSLSELQQRFPQLDIERGMAACGMDEELYTELFGDFVNLSIREELEKYLQAGDYKNYCILIHGFKNNAYSMGAKELGDLAYEMEKLTKTSMSEEVRGLQEKLLEQYDGICKLYKSVADCE